MNLMILNDFLVIKIPKIDFGEVTLILSREDVFSLVDGSENVEIARGVVASSVNFVLHEFVLCAVALPVAGPLLP